MSIRKIPSQFYNRTVTIQRRSLATDSIGDVSETWSDLATDVPATIQPIRVTELSVLQQGKQFRGDYRMFMPTNIVEIKNNDKIVDDTTEYLVVGVERHQAARKNITVGHHYTIYLEIPNSPKT